MYKYDQYDQQMVDVRVKEFRDQVRRRLDGSLTEDQFRPLRLQNGLYLQLHAYMLRVAVPYGTLNSEQMTVLGDIADKYDRGYGHFTTRQNIQYNWIKLEETPDLLAELAGVEMHAIQTSGNCIRNISSDQYAGAAADEIVDPRPYAELLRQWSSFHPEFLTLPRKFKIAVIASETDRAAMKLHDIGIQMVRNEAGKIGARCFVGGGMGRTPMIGPMIRDFVPLDQRVEHFRVEKMPDDDVVVNEDQNLHWRGADCCRMNSTRARSHSVSTLTKWPSSTTAPVRRPRMVCCSTRHSRVIA